MNENLNLVKILKDCPSGTKLYSPVYGDVELVEVIQVENIIHPIELNQNEDILYPIQVELYPIKIKLNMMISFVQYVGNSFIRKMKKQNIVLKNVQQSHYKKENIAYGNNSYYMKLCKACRYHNLFFTSS